MEVLTLNQLGYISAPVVILNTKGYYDKLIAQLNYCVEEGFTSSACLSIFAVADTPEAAVEMLSNMRPAELPDKIRDAIISAGGKA